MIDPNVLFVSYEFGPQVSGGVARVINGLSGALLGKLKFDVFLLQWRLALDDFSGDLFRSGLHQESYHTHYIETIRKLIQTRGYNVVHIMHSGEHTYALVKALNECGADVKIVFSSHSIAKHEQLIRNSSDRDLFHEDYLLKNSHHIHLLSETAKSWLLNAYPELAPMADFHIIPNAINCRATEHMEKLEKPEKIVLCMSRWSHGKGIEYLLDAIPHVVRELPDAKFIIAGRKESSWENDVLTYVKKIDAKIEKLSAFIEVLGWITDAEKDLLFAKASVVVMPSEIEYFPYSVLEPAAEKVALVSSRIAGAQEILVENRDCLMYETTDAVELAGKIIQLLRDPAMADALAEHAFENVSLRYTWNRVSDIYCNLYTHVVTNKELVEA
ncbi:glycosyltransferase involved in cell wall biosynthesis [Duganella sp. 1411]|jgi:glycosyltransferase involved in cell wall biosynthesis|uniref:glycosyltransferase family 4 protein n=1 Tax=Duganella sp. 1411 TaxID=2806572 RepID=UPI001AE1FEBA|nr:glycosyltransferase family 4 protein [Duganella sp. 1411]MBP1203662.1 glycosyltransferase involved in cell wall biosynthesis [Duganella sp. 1411]